MVLHLGGTDVKQVSLLNGAIKFAKSSILSELLTCKVEKVSFLALIWAGCHFVKFTVRNWYGL